MSVESPARYVGGEFNAIIKEDMMEEIEKTGKTSYVRFAFCFPDIYEIGMSNLALQILYHVLNESDFVACERAFSPWLDMDKILREKKIPLYSQETKTPLCDFDILGFTLGYEMCFTNVLQMQLWRFFSRSTVSRSRMSSVRSRCWSFMISSRSTRAIPSHMT